MTVDPIRGEAHRVFARAYRRRDPQATEQQVLDAWNALPAVERDWLLDTAGRVLAGAQALTDPLFQVGRAHDAGDETRSLRAHPHGSACICDDCTARDEAEKAGVAS